MKIFFTLLIFNCHWISYIVATNENITKYSKPEDAFTFQDPAFPISHENHTSTVICKLHLAARRREGITHYNLDDISREISFDGNLCTHVLYQSLYLGPTNDVVEGDDTDFIRKFTDFVRSKYPHLKTLAQIELSTEAKMQGKLHVEPLRRLVATKKSQEKIAENLEVSLRKLNFSGAYFSSDIYLSYPDPIFIDFAKVLKNQFNKYGRILITEMFAHVPDWILDYVTHISRIFDIVVIKGWAYNYNPIYKGNPAYWSPLFESEISKTDYVEKSMLRFIFKLRVSPTKLVLGITMLAQPFLLNTTNNNNMATRNSNIKSPLLGLDYWIYLEVCYSALAKNESWNVYWDNDAKVPFMEDGQRWISFDSPASVYEKVVVANRHGLLGIMLDSVDMDDFNGVCTKTKNPYLKAVNVALAKGEKEKESLLCPKFDIYKQNSNQNAKSRTDLVNINPYSQSAVAKSKMEINCSVDGPAFQNTTWIKVNDKDKESRIISGENNVVIHPSVFQLNPCLPYNKTVSTLEIQSLEVSNSGRYVCSVQSGIGKVRDSSLIYCKNNCTADEESVPVVVHGAITPWLWIAGTGIILIIFLGFIIAIVIWRVKLINNGLSTTEIGLFKNGVPNENKSSSDTYTNADEMAYDGESSEIPDDEYQIDRSSVLGCGAFGIVYKGRIKDITVAVKSTKPGCDKQYLKSLLQELKILAHIGKHPNIVSFLGAKTKLLSQGIAYIFVEYCALGSLEGFLRKSRGLFTPTEIGSENDGEMNRYNNCVTTAQLGLWSYQIICALQHLRLRKVIHGDLATRNILLSDNNVAKITDFGLSRRRYNYVNYIKKSKEPLPWRWMAIESLRDMTFSFQSDIWSLAVTLWEIFSLAETPYPGMTYSYDFINELENGHRMGMPKCATQQIYDLMEKCWNRFPDERPKIYEIEESFRLIINKRKSSESIPYWDI